MPTRRTINRINFVLALPGFVLWTLRLWWMLRKLQRIFRDCGKSVPVSPTRLILKAVKTQWNNET